MLAIVDYRIPKDVLRELEKHSEVLLFSTKGIVYDAISGHPDIFFCQTPWGLVAAPNTPREFLNKLNKLEVDFMLGKSSVGGRYPQTAHYNAFVSKNCIVHNTKITDSSILELASGIEVINVKQGYTLCNLIEAGGIYISSDHSILEALGISGKEAFYVSPQSILLPGVKHGFFGGCSGFSKGKLFFVGSIYNLPEGAELVKRLEDRDVTIVELYNGPLFDIGSILFLEH